MTLHIISDALQQRVTAHLSQFGTLARSVLWTGRGSIVVHFAEPITTSATDTRFAPLTVNWSATFRSPDGAIYLNVPASWRKADREAGEGEANVTAELTPLMKDLLNVLADGAVAIYGRWEAVNGDQTYGFAANSLTGLIKRGMVTKLGSTERYVINDDGRAAINRPIADPTTPIPANELENLDEPHDDIGTLVSDEAPLTVPDQAVVDPYAWATPSMRAALDALVARKHVYPQILEPSTTPNVWRIEDEWKVKTMQRTIDKIGGTLVGRLEQDWNGDEPYCVALFRLEVDGRPNSEPFPSQRPSKPAADPNSIHAQYDALHDSLPGATFLLIQANGDEWLAFQMDAMLLRRYAPLCRFSPQTVNQAGEQWDKLVVPAGVLDELITEANEGGLTVALASIVRDEPNQLPIREVTEIHRPNEPVQYIGKEAPPTEWETEVDEDAQSEAARELHLTPGTGVLHPMMAEATPNAEPKKLRAEAPKLEMTPELMAAKIRLKLHGGLRVGRIEDVRYDGKDEIEGDWWTVWFAHATSAKNPSILKRIAEDFDIRSYDIGLQNKYTLTVRPKQIAPHGTAIEQATAVIDALPELPAAPEPEPATALLSEDDERDLIAALKLEHADIDAATFGITHFLLNVIAKMRAVEAARVY